jgi:CheY-like chemotaxis protein
MVAGSGREALDILGRDRAFDVVLCDLMMPEISGMDVYEAVRVGNPELASRMVFMTGGAFTPRARQFLQTTSSPHLVKPFPPEALHDLVGRVAARVTAHPPRRVGEARPRRGGAERHPQRS